MKFLRTISALVLALLVLVSSTSFMIGMHICMGEVQQVKLLTKAEVCAMQQKLPPCHREKKASCCDDQTVVHKADDLKASVDGIDQSAFIPLYIEQSLILISEIIPSAPAARIQYFNYDPPLRSIDLTVDHQSFLI